MVRREMVSFVDPPETKNKDKGTMDLKSNEKTAADCLLMLGQRDKKRGPGPVLKSQPPAFPTPPNRRYATQEPHLVPTRRGYPIQSASTLPSALMMRNHRRQRVPAVHHPGLFTIPPASQRLHGTAPLRHHVMRPTHNHHYPPHHHHHRVGLIPNQVNVLGKARAVSPSSVHSSPNEMSDRMKPPSADGSPRSILSTTVSGNNKPCSALPQIPDQQQDQPKLEKQPEEEDGEIRPGRFDVLIGTGRTCSSHPGNRRFHKEIYDSCQDYFDADYKKGIVDRAIRSVHQRGGRFLTKKGDEWTIVTDHDRLERNTRKSFHMARKQRETQAERLREDQEAEAARGPPPPPPPRGKGPFYGGASTHKPSPPTMPTEVGNKGLHVAIYRQETRGYCIATIEARAKNLYLLRFDDARLGTEWVDLDKSDCRVFAM